MRAIIFDIDGTLADASHRLHHVTGPARDWDAFFAAMGDDPLIEPIGDLLRAIVFGTRDVIVLCSGRPENYRRETVLWMDQYHLSFQKLYMRPAGDHRPDHVVKLEMLAKMRADGYEPWLAIDDRPSIVAMWRENGITCLQCRDWNERHDPAHTSGLLTLMVGPSGAGKTTWLQEAFPFAKYKGDHPMYGIHPSHVVSSDQVRVDLCGDFRDQTRNDEVFAALHAVVGARIAHGLPTVVDATNLRRRDRLAAVALSSGGPVRYIVIDRTMDEKLRDAGWRAELPFDLISRHDQTFHSQLKDILAGDGLPNVTVVDLRRVT